MPQGRVCTKCDIYREPDMLYKLPNGDWYCWCKNCMKEKKKKYHQTAKGKASLKRNKKKHGYKGLCRRIVSAGFKENILPRSQCQAPGCSLMKVQGHHYDYMRPIDVIWLCQHHHSALHASVLDEKLLIKNRFNHAFYYKTEYFDIIPG